MILIELLRKQLESANTRNENKTAARSEMLQHRWKTRLKSQSFGPPPHQFLFIDLRFLVKLLRLGILSVTLKRTRKLSNGIVLCNFQFFVFRSFDGDVGVGKF